MKFDEDIKIFSDIGEDYFIRKLFMKILSSICSIKELDKQYDYYYNFLNYETKITDDQKNILNSAFNEQKNFHITKLFICLRDLSDILKILIYDKKEENNYRYIELEDWIIKECGFLSLFLSLPFKDGSNNSNIGESKDHYPALSWPLHNWNDFIYSDTKKEKCNEWYKKFNKKMNEIDIKTIHNELTKLLTKLKVKDYNIEHPGEDFPFNEPFQFTILINEYLLPIELINKCLYKILDVVIPPKNETLPEKLKHFKLLDKMFKKI